MAVRYGMSRLTAIVIIIHYRLSDSLYT